MPIEEIASNVSVDVAVVLEADLDAVRSPAAATRSRASAACASLIVMPTTLTSKCDAAWIAIEPQPHPTSRSRPPGSASSPSLRAMRSCLASWAVVRSVSSSTKRAHEYVIDGPSTSR